MKSPFRQKPLTAEQKRLADAWDKVYDIIKDLHPEEVVWLFECMKYEYVLSR